VNIYMQKREAKFTPVFESWLRNVGKFTCAWETKVTTDDSWPYSRLETQQENFLMTTVKGCAVYKISDESIGYKPCDGVSFSKERGVVAILYKQSNIFYVIDIERLIDYRDTKATRKSLLESEAKEIATEIVQLKK
jgi:hypothetical protein